MGLGCIFLVNVAFMQYPFACKAHQQPDAFIEGVKDIERKGPAGDGDLSGEARAECTTGMKPAVLLEGDADVSISVEGPAQLGPVVDISFTFCRGELGGGGEVPVFAA